MSPGRYMDDEKSKRVLQYWKGGLSHRTLARMFMVSPATIRNELRRAGADRVRAEEGRVLAKGDRYGGSMGKETTKRMWELGLTITELAERANVDPYQIGQIVDLVRYNHRWCPPTEDYKRLRDFLWGAKSTE